MTAGWFLAAALLLAGCSRPADEPEPWAAAMACNIGDRLIRPRIGRSYTDAIGLDLKRNSRSAVLRVVRPGDVMTTDFRSDRLTIRLDGQGKIAGATCG